MSQRIEGIAWAALAVLLAATAYEALVAVQVIPLGEVPGADAPGATFVGVCAGFAFLLAIVACLARTSGAHAAASVVWILLAPAGFAFLLARWLTFDTYYLPSLRRYSEDEIHRTWIAIVLVASVAAALLAWRLPRAGAFASALVLVVSALTAWILPIGK